MFEKKVRSLMKGSTPSKNGFVAAGLKESAKTTSGNGAMKYDTSGNDFVDDFASAAIYKKPRTYAEVSATMEKLWAEDPVKALKLSVYLRLITRRSRIINEKKKLDVTLSDTQRGQGLKNEGIMRMLWIAVNQPLTFKANLPYYIAAGSWKDIFQMLSLDLQYHGWKGRKLDWNFMLKVIKTGLANENTTHLVRKYLPTIRNSKRCKTLESQANTLIGRWLALRLFSEDVSEDLEGTEKKVALSVLYRQLKANGIAHQWQQKISKELYDEINFDTIAGRALALLVGSKFLENHKLTEKYSEWIGSKKNAKYTGFVFELFSPLGNSHRANTLPEHQEATIQAQFNTLVETGKVNNQSKLLVVRDISGSMTAKAMGCEMSSYAIAKAMALYFSEFLDGPFKNAYAVFSDKCKLREWKGNTVCEKWRNDRADDYGSTDFMSVAELLVNIKKQGVPEEEFPTGALLLSDGEFNRPYWGTTLAAPNFLAFRAVLKSEGFSDEFVDNFKLILWDIPNNYYEGRKAAKFEDFADAPNNFYMSGYDPAAIAFIMGNGEFKASPRNAEELFEEAMDQELLNCLVVIPPKAPKMKKKQFKNRKR